MNVGEELNAFFEELEQAEARMNTMMADVESVVDDGAPSLRERKEDVAMLIGVMMAGLSAGDIEGQEAFARAVSTIFMLGFYEGRRGSG